MISVLKTWSQKKSLIKEFADGGWIIPMIGAAANDCSLAIPAQ
jgi:hypothetical protein